MKRFFALLLTLCLCALAVLPISAAVVPQDQNVADVQAALAASLGKDTPGAAVALFSGSERLVLEGYGYADLASRTLVTPDTVFEIGDLSALFVSLAALALAEEGRFDLDADITAYFEKSFTRKLDMDFPRTARQLLSGYSGFEARLFDLRFEKSSQCFQTLKEALVADIPAQNEGLLSVYSHSPFAIALVAYAIEQVTGSYTEYVSDKILLPLGMTQTALNPGRSTRVQNAAVGYTVQKDGRFRAQSNNGRSYGGLYPANGALSTLGDLASLVDFILNGKNGAILSDASRASLFAPALSGGMFPLSSLGLSANSPAFGISSSTLSFGASLWINPITRMGAVVLTSTAQSELLSLPQRLTGAKTPVAVGALGEGSLPDVKTYRGSYTSARLETSSFVGRYLTANQNLSVTVNKEDGTISVGELRLRQIAPGVFENVDEPGYAVARFSLDAKGRVQSLAMLDESFVKTPFYLTRGFATVMLALLFVLSVWLVLTGAFGVFRYIVFPDDREDTKSLYYVVPNALAGVMGGIAIWQILVGLTKGTAALSSFYNGLGVLMLVVTILATLAYLFAFVLSFLNRKLHRRVAYMATLFVVFIFLAQFLAIM